MSEKVKKSDNKQINDEHIKNLTKQAKEYAEMAEYYKTMALKSQGALEVLLELKESK